MLQGFHVGDLQAARDDSFLRLRGQGFLDEQLVAAGLVLQLRVIRSRLERDCLVRVHSVDSGHLLAH